MKDRGFIIVLVAFTLVILFTFGTFLLQISKTDFDIAITQVAKTQAYYNAESTINQALAQLKADNAILDELNNIISSLSEGGVRDFTINVPIIGADGVITGDIKPVNFTIRKDNEGRDGVTISVNSRGTYSGKYGVANQILNIQIKPNKWSLPEDAAIVSEGVIILKNNIFVEGNIYAKEFDNHSDVNRNISGDPFILNSGIYPLLTEDQFVGWQTIDVSEGTPSINLNNLVAVEDGYWINSNKKNIDIYGEYSGHIILVFSDDVILTNDPKRGPIIAAHGDLIHNSLMIICFGDVVFNNGSDFQGIIFAPNGSVTIMNDGNITGTILSNVFVEGKNIVNFIFNEDIASYFNSFVSTNLDIGNLGFNVVYWK
ncbi:MAG: hypothetical protein ACOX47_06155 [Bacillota bacterium]